MGVGYLTEQVIRYHKDDILNRMCLVIENGKKVAMPRYYKDKIYSEFERTLVGNYQKDQVLEREQKDKVKYENTHKGDSYERHKVESHIAQFEKQKQSSLKRDKL